MQRKDKMITGLFTMEDKEYFAKGGLSNSSFRLLELSVNHYLNSHLFRLEGKQLSFGSAVHHYVLENDTFKDFYIVEDFEHCDKNKNSIIYKDAKKNFDINCKGKYVLSKDDMVKLEKMKKNIDVIYGELLDIKNSKVELSMFAPLHPLQQDEHMQIQMRGKADLINDDLQVIVDLKTTASIKKFTSSAIDYNYISQAALYKRLMKEITGKEYRFLFLLVEVSPPHMVSLVELDDVAIEIGNTMIDKYIKKLWEYYDTGNILLSKTTYLPSWFREKHGYS